MNMSNMTTNPLPSDSHPAMTEPRQRSSRPQFRLWHYALAGALAWTALIVATAGWSGFERQRGMLANARHEAQVSFQQEMLLQFWVMGHGDSTPATNNAPPSAALARTAKRALFDSTAMLRQIQGRSSEPAGYRSRLSSVKPLRPENAPDAWEAAALQAFAKGETEVASVATMDGQEYMRVMRPLMHEASCIMCHGDQDYKVGDIHGGMSVSVPLAPLRVQNQRELVAQVITDGVIWVLGLGVIGFGARRMQAHNLERARAETVLRNSEMRYHALADSGQALIWTSGPDKKCDYFNQPWLALTGRTLEQELGDGWAKEVHPDDLARCLKTYAAAFDRREAFSLIYRLRRHDGEFRWIQGDGSPRHDSQGNFVGYIGHGFDITERKQTEIELRASEERFRIVAETANDVVYEWDLKQSVQWLGKIDELLGYEPGEFPRTLDGWAASVHPEDVERTMAAIHAHLEGRAPYSTEYRVRRKDGVYRRWSARGAATRTPDGKPVRLIGSITDITERKRAEAALVETSALLETLLQNMTDGIYFKDLQSRFVHFSREMLTLFHLTHPEELKGRTDFDFFFEEHARPAFEGEQEIIRTGKPILNLEEKETHLDGRITWVSTSKTPWRDQAGNVLGTMGISRDITEQKRTQAELENLHKKLVDASRQAGMAEIATNVLHNVGNVLNSVNISTTLIVQNVKQSKVSSLAKVVVLLQEHAHNLGEFITHDSRGKHVPAHLGQLSEHLLAEQETNVRELALLRQNIEHIKEIVAMQQNYSTFGGVKEMVNVVNLVEDSLRINEGALSRHHVEVVREFEAVPPLNAERHKILQVLVNLLRNAKHACQDSERADKRLTVRVAKGEGRIRISVIDNGVGIPPENLTRIFNYGFTTRKGGHGFGLHSGALAAQEMGGSLTVHSDGIGQGAAFTLELPLPDAGESP
jgi:PAS domain S-box-containing protein